MSDPRRAIPAVDRLLESQAFAPLLERSSRARVRAILEEIQSELRTHLSTDVRLAREAADDSDTPAHTKDTAVVPVHAEWYAERVRQHITASDWLSLRPVINATGVVLHTNLGRAPLAKAARAAVEVLSAGYANLEYDLDHGRRGSRYDHCATLLTELTGAEAALVVNNNAAAVSLALNTLSSGHEAIVSRGELVEIGGAFRIPEIVTASGARLREVGTTNRTRAQDYHAAIGEETGTILRVHRSNFRILGFTEEASLTELVQIGREAGVPVIEDLGSGLLHDLSEFGLPDEPTAGESIQVGVDVVTMSGDKLLGGPQAGIILGSEEHIEAMRTNPLCRAFRVDKMTLTALEATLRLYHDPERARQEIPTLQMLATPGSELQERADRITERLNAEGVRATTQPGESAVGGGALPGATLPTTLIALETDQSATTLERELRESEPAIIARIMDGRVVLDPRTIRPEEEDTLIETIKRATR